jgi:ribosomal protein S18 acetylase RimI-like enzyme
MPATMKTTLTYTTRKATASDYAYCYRLTKRNMLGLFTRHWGGWVPAKFREGFVVADIEMIIVAGRRAGLLSLRTSADGIFIDNIQISPAQTGRGIGTSILGKLIRRQGRKVLSLTTFDDNPAKRLYERLGFVVVRREGARLSMERAPG